MATTYKTFLSNDVVSTRTLLHEAIPVTGTIVSGVYGDFQSEANVKNYSHGMFQSVYDYPYLSSSANHIFDLGVCYSANSSFSGASNTQNSKKINVYNQLAQVLMGYDATGSILEFDEDGDILAGGTKLRECFYMNFARLLNKDEIKKGTFALTLGVHSNFDNAHSGTIKISDAGATTDYRVNSPAGEYAILYANGLSGSHITSQTACGLLFYQAGIAIVTGSVFTDVNLGGKLTNTYGHAEMHPSMGGAAGSSGSFNHVLTGSSISASCDYIRHRIKNVEFNNTTELNSTIYFARINHNDYNYSANPTYLSASKIRVKNSTTDSPVSYITTVGLYSADNELLAVAKLSEPLKKDPTTEFTLRVRLDY